MKEQEMLKKKEQELRWNVLLVTISISFLLISCISKPKGESIVSMNIYSIHWNTSIRYSINAKDILSWKHKRNVIKSEDALKLISERIDKLEELPGFDGVNLRMFCVMNYSDGKTDTLKIGSTKIFMYHGVVYNKDSVLVNLIEDNMIPVE